jgi:AraC-like DNA-binding protein
MDRLAAVLAHFQIRAQVFHAGLMCGTSRFARRDGTQFAIGHLHVLKTGRLHWHGADPKLHPQIYQEPTLFVATGPHQIKADVDDAAELLCAEINFGVNMQSPALRALPGVTAIRLSEAPQLTPLLTLLFDEAFTSHCGREHALNRYAELVLIHALRYAMDRLHLEAGLLAGLGDAQLARALVAIHSEPGATWSLDKLAGLSNMSRSRFAARFKALIGQTPNDYLVDWRLSVAMEKLRRGVATKIVATEVGYADGSALARAFAARLGTSPKAWLAGLGS